MATWICVNIGSGKGMLPDGTKPYLPTSIRLRAMAQERPQPPWLIYA